MVLETKPWDIEDDIATAGAGVILDCDRPAGSLVRIVAACEFFTLVG